MRGARLVQWCELFGVAEGTTRVALSRMVERGELRANDGVYAIAGRVQTRKGAQDWSLDPVFAPWEGEWRTAVVAAGPREASDRAGLRDAMRRLRYAPLRDGMWTRPDNLPRESAPVESWKVVDEQCSWWSGRPDEDPASLATELFDSGSWSARADMLTSRLRVATSALVDAREGALADGFVVGAASLAHVRVDPLLPSELVADASAGGALRVAYRSYEDAFSNALRTWFLEH
ncbi:MAG: phenylacetic acid degradation operon negative regulatory protein [Actinomycetota bacterium]|jgi:phenylacetic acid degradation operon negative regulatory protein|nr:phenylacetic acid degradation operon negative regulatory protein [Actinomycetota bacterium]